ncbi:MAG: aldolase/citrate lyase family protein [Bacteroidota bacterium]
MSLQHRLRQPEPLLNFFLLAPNPWTAEWLSAGFCESLTLDLQHGMIEDAHLLPLVQAIRAGGGIPVARLAWNRPDRIMKALDLGIELLICPMIDGPADAAAFVRAAKYPPLGNRSYGPCRAGFYAEEDYFTTANETASLCFAMIETAGAYAELEAIAATPGLDGLYVGPYDLSVSNGLQRKADFSDPELLAMIDRVREVARSHDLFSGVFTMRAEDARAMADKGFDLITCGTEDFVFQRGAQDWFAQLD